VIENLQIVKINFNLLLKEKVNFNLYFIFFGFKKPNTKK